MANSSRVHPVCSDESHDTPPSTRNLAFGNNEEIEDEMEDFATNEAHKAEILTNAKPAFRKLLSKQFVLGFMAFVLLASVTALVLTAVVVFRQQGDKSLDASGTASGNQRAVAPGGQQPGSDQCTCRSDSVVPPHDASSIQDNIKEMQLTISLIKKFMVRLELDIHTTKDDLNDTNSNINGTKDQLSQLETGTSDSISKIQSISKLQGATGPPGFNGSKGDRGRDGPQGPIGPNGAQGDAGGKGDKGEPGKNGTDGVDGPKGDLGPQGDKGNPGSAGLQGPQGPVGPQGPQGAGNFSQCVYGTAVQTATVSGFTATFALVTEQDGKKILGATCSTNRAAEYNLDRGILPPGDPDAGKYFYRCTCKGLSALFTTGSPVECIVHFWECPLTT